MAASNGVYGTWLDDQFDTTQAGLDYDSDVMEDMLVTELDDPGLRRRQDRGQRRRPKVSGNRLQRRRQDQKARSPRRSPPGSSPFDGADQSWTSATVSSIEARVFKCATPDQVQCMTDFATTYNVTAGHVLDHRGRQRHLPHRLHPLSR